LPRRTPPNHRFPSLRFFWRFRICARVGCAHVRWWSSVRLCGATTAESANVVLVAKSFRIFVLTRSSLEGWGTLGPRPTTVNAAQTIRHVPRQRASLRRPGRRPVLPRQAGTGLLRVHRRQGGAGREGFGRLIFPRFLIAVSRFQRRLAHNGQIRKHSLNVTVPIVSPRPQPAQAENVSTADPLRHRAGRVHRRAAFPTVCDCRPKETSLPRNPPLPRRTTPATCVHRKVRQPHGKGGRPSTLVPDHQPASDERFRVVV